uniref:MalT-like TPR region domain-containing protein n=1 Tax=Grammatophora oceanica TaxID=210454 RepID=A0A7S1V0R8_9STRA
MRNADRVIKACSKLVSEGCENMSPTFELLKAERHSQVFSKAAAATGEKAVDCFSSAIRAAEAGNIFPHIRALAYERAGFAMLRANERKDAEAHLCRALELYDEWGATRKVQALEAKTLRLFGRD